MTTASPRRRLFVCLVLASALVWPLTSRPSSAQQAPVTICFNGWPPYAFTRDGQANGISITIIREAARRLDRRVEFRELPWNRCLQVVREGEIDAVVDAAKREEFIQGPASFSIYSDTFWVPAGGSLKRLQDLRGLRIGLVDGYRYGERLSQEIDELELVQEFAVDDQTNIRKLAFRRIDVMVGDLASTLSTVRERRLELRPLLPPISVDRLYLSFSKKKREMQRGFDRAFEGLVKDGFVDRVYRQMLGMSFSELVNNNRPE